MKMLKKPFLMIPICLVVIAVIVIFSTAHYSHKFGLYQMSEAPFFTITVAGSDRWIVRSGINVVPDRSVGPAGNIIEFPICPGYRAGIKYFSRRWWHEYHEYHRE